MSYLEEIVRKHQDGAILNLYVIPKAQANHFPAGYDKWRKRIIFKVTSNPKDNKANLDVIKISARFFDKPVKNICIVSGKKSREKTILIKQISVNDVIKMLKESLDGL